MVSITDHHLVSTAWLDEHLQSPDVKPVDATWYLPTESQDAKQQFEEQHIPGSVYFDIDDIRDEQSALPHMLPSPIKFSARMRKLGLGDGHRIVVYDRNNLFASARVWWMFRVFGHEDVAVLDGGFRKWAEEGRPVTDDGTQPVSSHFTSRQNSLLLRDLDQMRQNMSQNREQVIDLRSPERFSGSTEEPRPGLRAGHIPNSINLFYKELVSATGELKNPAELKKAFLKVGIDLKKPVVSTCGSGVSAAVAALALAVLGYPQSAVYDGSWTEWGGRNDTPVTRL